MQFEMRTGCWQAANCDALRLEYLRNLKYPRYGNVIFFRTHQMATNMNTRLGDILLESTIVWMQSFDFPGTTGYLVGLLLEFTTKFRILGSRK